MMPLHKRVWNSSGGGVMYIVDTHFIINGHRPGLVWMYKQDHDSMKPNKKKKKYSFVICYNQGLVSNYKKWTDKQNSILNLIYFYIHRNTYLIFYDCPWISKINMNIHGITNCNTYSSMQIGVGRIIFTCIMSILYMIMKIQQQWQNGV